MNTRIQQRLALLFAATALSATVASAQVPIPADPDPTRLANAPNEPGVTGSSSLVSGLFTAPLSSDRRTTSTELARTSRFATGTASTSR